MTYTQKKCRDIVIMFFDKIRPLYFLLAFTVGLFYCYLTKPQPSIVMKFPSPMNAGNVTYKNEDGTCYKYESSKEECPRDKNLIKPQPLGE
jgi:hypothetical protein